MRTPRQGFPANLECSQRSFIRRTRHTYGNCVTNIRQAELLACHSDMQDQTLFQGAIRARPRPRSQLTPLVHPGMPYAPSFRHDAALAAMLVPCLGQPISQYPPSDVSTNQQRAQLERSDVWVCTSFHAKTSQSRDNPTKVPAQHENAAPTVQQCHNATMPQQHNATTTQ